MPLDDQGKPGAPFEERLVLFLAGDDAEAKKTVSGAVARLGCLDLQAPMALLSGLRQRGVRAYVLPVGADALAGDGPWVFNSLAEAGGTARDCPQGTHAECGGSNTCDAVTRQCTWRLLGPGELDRILGH